tara:strand:- start:138 stop:281 length:144 start_codon:yes stop_codon:yes gene_type:complete
MEEELDKLVDDWYDSQDLIGTDENEFIKIKNYGDKNDGRNIKMGMER